MPESLEFYNTICTPRKRNIIYGSADAIAVNINETCDIRSIGDDKNFAYISAVINTKWAKYKTIINTK